MHIKIVIGLGESKKSVKISHRKQRVKETIPWGPVAYRFGVSSVDVEVEAPDVLPQALLRTAVPPHFENGDNSVTVLRGALVPHQVPLEICLIALLEASYVIVCAWGKLVFVNPQAFPVLSEKHIDRCGRVRDVIGLNIVIGHWWAIHLALPGDQRSRHCVLHSRLHLERLPPWGRVLPCLCHARWSHPVWWHPQC